MSTWQVFNYHFIYRLEQIGNFIQFGTDTFSSLHETVLWKRCLIRTYELCDLDLTLLVQVHYCTMVVYLVGGLFLWAGFNASLILHLQI